MCMSPSTGTTHAQVVHNFPTAPVAAIHRLFLFNAGAFHFHQISGYLAHFFAPYGVLSSIEPAQSDKKGIQRIPFHIAFYSAAHYDAYLAVCGAKVQLSYYNWRIEVARSIVAARKVKPQRSNTPNLPRVVDSAVAFCLKDDEEEEVVVTPRCQ